MKKILIAFLFLITFSCNNKKEPASEPAQQEIEFITDSVVSKSSIQPSSTAVDLMAVGMSSKPVMIKIGQTTRLSTIMKNNGPMAIPTDQAMVHITVNGRYVSLADNIGFRHFADPIWKLKFMQPLNGNYELYFFNRVPLVTTSTAQGFTFTVKGTAKGDADITLVSSLSLESTVGDIDGMNGSAQIVITVK